MDQKSFSIHYADGMHKQFCKNTLYDVGNNPRVNLIIITQPV